MSRSMYKILALDGGGIRGVISARILQEVENQIQKPLNQYFDLIAGTSTGSIIAAGLAIGLTPSELLKLYQTEGRRIFNHSWIRNILKWVNQPKFSNDGLIQVLRQYFQHHQQEVVFGQLSELSQARLLILAYDTLFRNTTFFISHLPTHQQRWYYDLKLWEICCCSAAAPTFFPPYELRWRDSQNPNSGEWCFPHVDGGMSANNPALAALGHVLGIEKQKLEDVAILTIGTGKVTEPLQYQQMKKWGMLGWAQQIPNVFMAGQFQLTSDLCDQILTSANPNGYLRLNFELNKRFQRNSPFSQPVCLPKQQQVNRYTHEKISEEMDDASQETIQQLLNVTEAFLNSENYINLEGHALSVKEVISKFIQNNP